MGFPNWTLWGMALSGLAALVTIGLAYISQTPRFLSKSGLGGYRLDLRTRTFTGYGFAFLLMAFGFFLAGVPLGPGVATPVAMAEPTLTPTPTLDINPIEGSAESITPQSPVLPQESNPDANSTRSTGAFGSPPTGSGAVTPVSTPPADTAAIGATATVEVPPTSTPTATATSTFTPTPTPTLTASPTPTYTPSPTFTPTPIEGETTVINSGGIAVSVRRIPGGQSLLLLNDGDTVILLPGHANQGGIFWREVRTVSGIRGWVPEEFLLINETE